MISALSLVKSPVRFGHVYRVINPDNPSAPLPCRLGAPNQQPQLAAIDDSLTQMAAQTLCLGFQKMGIPAIWIMPDLVVTQDALNRFAKHYAAVVQGILKQLPEPSKKHFADDSPALKRTLDTRRLMATTELNALLDFDKTAYPVYVTAKATNRCAFKVTPKGDNGELIPPPHELLKVLNTLHAARALMVYQPNAAEQTEPRS